MIRVGTGYDSHRLEAGATLVLGGVRIPHTHGLIGHSDADAVAHALIDALLGAAALGDVGRMFPDTDPAYRGADSIGLLEAASEHLREHGWVMAQCDITVIAERPKLAPYIEPMQQRVAMAVGVSPGAVSIKAKTNEGMGFIGRGEGIAVMAVATIAPR